MLASKRKERSEEPKEASRKAAKDSSTKDAAKASRASEAAPKVILTVESVRSMEQQIKESKKNINSLVPLVAAVSKDGLANRDPIVVLAASQALRRLFLSYYVAGDLTSKDEAKLSEAQIKVQTWLTAQLRKFCTSSCVLLARAVELDVPQPLQFALVDTLVDLAIAAAGDDQSRLTLVDSNSLFSQVSSS